MNEQQQFDFSGPEAQALCEALTLLEELDEYAAFLGDLCTRRELSEMVNRWRVAQLLEQGLTYRQITERTGVAGGTVARVNAYLRRGNGGYRLALDRLNDPPRKGQRSDD